MEKLTQNQVLEMSKEERVKNLNYFQDLACNTDYVKEPLLSDIINYNINKLESKIEFNEY